MSRVPLDFSSRETLAYPNVKKTWAAHLAAVACIAVACAGVFGPGLLGRLPWVRDVPGFTFPSRYLWRDAVLNGHLPEWNPYVQMGVPMLPTPVHGVLYPGHLPLLLGTPEFGFALTWYLHAVLVGLGGYALARALGCGAVASTISGLLWSLGGYSVSMWWNGEKVLSQAWIPWVAFFLVRAGTRGWRAKELSLAALGLALMATAGDPFLWFPTLVLAVPLAWANALELVRESTPEPWRVARRVVGQVSLAVCLGFLLSAVVLIPAWLLRPETERALSYGGELADRWSMAPVRLLEWLAPGALGNPLDLEQYPGRDFAQDPEHQALPWAVSLYTGAVVWFAAACGRGRRAIVLVITLAFGLLCALGEYTPFYGALRSAIPPLGWMRYPEKHALIVAGALSCASALGVERVLNKQASLRAVGAAFLGATALAALLAPEALRVTTLAGTAHAAVALAALAGALFVSVRRTRFAPLCCLVVAADLVVAHAPLTQWAEPKDQASGAQLASLITNADTSAPPRVYRPRQAHLSQDSLPDQWAATVHVGTYPGHDPAKSGRLREVTDRLPLPQRVQYLQTGWVLLPPEESPPLPLVAKTADAWNLYRGPELPRAWRAAGALSVSQEEALERLAAGHPPIGPLLVPETEAPESASGPAVPCTLQRPDAEHVQIDCPSGSEGWLVWAESYYPGWSASTDDQTLTVVPGNVAYQAVHLPAGTQRVSLEYHTPGLVFGLWLCVSGAVACVAWLTWDRRRLSAVTGARMDTVSVHT